MYFSSFMFPATVSMNSIASEMICEAQKEKEVNMDKSTVPCFTRERDALRSAMWSASHTKDQALQKHFGTGLDSRCSWHGDHHFCAQLESGPDADGFDDASEDYPRRHD